MLIPPGMSKKERDAYVKKNTHQMKNLNQGPKAGLRPPGGDPKVAKKTLKDKIDVTSK